MQSSKLSIDFKDRVKEANKTHFPLYAGDLSELSLIARSRNISVIITGPTGTGKSFAAQRIHELSGCEGHFRRINCSNINPELFESEMFGHVKGSYTGAIQDTTGLVVAADKGTLFIDEVGDVPMVSQAKLLMFLEDHKYTRVGSPQQRLADVRIIAATNKDLHEEIRAGRFRADLYYRLNGFPMEMVAMTERPEIVNDLINSVLQTVAKNEHTPPKTLTKAARIAIAEYPWPGNIRQMEKVLGIAFALSRTQEIDVQHLKLPAIESYGPRPKTKFPIHTPMATVETASQTPAEDPFIAAAQLGLEQGGNWGSIKKRFSTQLALQALAVSHGNVLKASDVLGTPRSNFYKILRDHGIVPKEEKKKIKKAAFRGIDLG